MKKVMLIIGLFVLIGCVNLDTMLEQNATQEQRDIVFTNTNTIISIAYCVAYPRSAICNGTTQVKPQADVKFKVINSLDVNGTKTLILKKVK